MTVGYYRLPNQAHEHQNTAKCLIVGKILVKSLSQVPQPLLRGIYGVAWPHSLATAPLCQLVQTPKPIECRAILYPPCNFKIPL